MLTMMKNESELKAMVNLEMLLVHVRVRNAGQRHKRLLHSLKYFRRIFFKFPRFAFFSKQYLHLCKTRFAFVQNKICTCAKQDLHFCKARFAFLQNNICICAKQYLHFCKRIFAFVQNKICICNPPVDLPT